MNKEKKKTKGKYAWLLYLLLFFVLFVGFIWLLSIPSTCDKAIEKIESVSTLEDLKQLYQENKNLDCSDFEIKIRDKICESFPDSININGLPKTPTYFNLIIVPDLSGRLKDNIDQIEFDTIVLKNIWHQFISKLITSDTLKGSVKIDLTSDKNETPISRRLCKDNIFRFDTIINIKQDRIDFIEEQTIKFNLLVQKLYSAAQDEKGGADYGNYFREISNPVSSNCKENFRNVIVLLTDGYFELSGGPYYTKLQKEHWDIYNETVNGNLSFNSAFNNSFFRNNLIQPDINRNLPGFEILMLEIRTRPKTNWPPCEKEILLEYWKRWFIQLGVKNKMERDVSFIFHDPNPSVTEVSIKNYFK